MAEEAYQPIIDQI